MLKILVPVYNGIPHVREALSSILDARQGSNDPIAIIISDNSSSDATCLEVKTFASAANQQNLTIELREQSTNVGCYGNLEILKNLCGRCWGYILCADDTLLPSILREVIAEIDSAGPDVSMIAFSDQTSSLQASRRQVKRLNGSPTVKGKRGIALFFLFGCFVGGLSNVCINPKSLNSIIFDQSYAYFGDINFYVDLLIGGGSILLSETQTNYRRSHPGQISATGGKDNSHFWEARSVVYKCINHLAASYSSRLALLFFAHSVLFYQFYRLAFNKAIAGDLTAFRNLSRCHQGGWLCVLIFVMGSCFMTFSPAREFLRSTYRVWILNRLC